MFSLADGVDFSLKIQIKKFMSNKNTSTSQEFAPGSLDASDPKPCCELESNNKQHDDMYEENKRKNEPTGKRYRREIEEVTKDLDSRRNNLFSSCDLSSYAVRIKLTSKHPMLENGYFINTDDTNNFYDAVFDHLFARKSGLYITGEFRVGKTTCISNAISRLSSELPHIYVGRFSAVRNHSQSKVAFCRDILNSFRNYPSPHQNAIEAVPRFLITKAACAGSRTCAIFVDEAQKLTVRQLGYLLEIWNEVRQEGFTLVTILVGQTDLDNLYQLTEQEDHGAVISRFFVNKFCLGGIHSQEDLEKYLSAYDDKLFYPMQSEWSYARFFRANAFDEGWRMAKECANFWLTLMDRTNASDESLLYKGFRLAFINDAIHSFLIDSMRSKTLSNKESMKLWQQSVASAATSDLLIGHVSN